MVLGFNHNFTYKGEVFHVQTEDSGMANPHIITVLYRGGVIICSKKTSYADIIKMDKLEGIVEDLMKEQHKEMMRRLKGGEYDEKAFSCIAPMIKNYEIPALAPEAVPVAGAFPTTYDDPVSHVRNTVAPDANSRGASPEEAILAFFGPREK